MSFGLILAALTVHSVVTNGVEVRWFEDFVPMRDGTKLYTYGTVPAQGAKLPIVVQRTPYAARSRIDGPSFAGGQQDWLNRGYAFVSQHVRGAGLSEGNLIPSENEREDGLAFLDYIRRLPWYDGELFVTGSSFLALVHWAYLNTNPPDVKGAMLAVEEFDAYNLAFRNGCFRTGLIGMVFVNQYYKNDTALTRNKGVRFTDFPLSEFSRRFWGRPVVELDNPMRHPRPDDPFWRSDERASGADYRGALSKSTMPILLKTALYDVFPGEICEMWRTMTPERRANCALVIDAYGHDGKMAKGMKGTYGEFPNGSRRDAGVEPLDWFDAIRAGRPCPGAAYNATRYYALWENAWHVAPELADGPRRVAFALGAGKREYAYDPKRPLPKFPGAGGLGCGDMQVQPEPGFRDDVLSFVLPPLKERLDVRGRMTARLTVASDCEDTCFYVRSSVRKPDGKWYVLREDITSLSFQLGDYVPGTKRALAFRFTDHAFRLEPGDVLRVDVASASTQYAPHTNVKGEQWAIREPKVAHNTVFAAESELVLPCLPAAAPVFGEAQYDPAKKPIENLVAIQEGVDGTDGDCILVAPVPRGWTKDDPAREAWDLSGRVAFHLCDTNRIHYLDLSGRFLGRDGSRKRDLYEADGLRLNAAGRAEYEKGMKPLADWLASDRTAPSPESKIVRIPVNSGPRFHFRHLRDNRPRWWWDRTKAKLAEADALRARGGGLDLLIVGDSISHRWEYESSGAPVYAKMTNAYSVLNVAIGGDRWEQQLWMVKSGLVDGLKPRYVSILIGANNHEYKWAKDSPERTRDGVKAIIDAVRARCPDAKFILYPILMRLKDDPQTRTDRANDIAARPLLKDLAGKEGAIWLEFDHEMRTAVGGSEDVWKKYTTDTVHLTTYMFERWYEALEPVLETK